MPATKSPLRYPGGKTQLAKFVEHTIQLNRLIEPIYCEPFSGGSGVAIALLLKNAVTRIILNDYDPAIYSFWRAIIDETDRFTDSINRIEITLEEWYNQKNNYNTILNQNRQEYDFDLGFATFFLNRTNRSGIIRGGPIGGHTQDALYKLDCRFNKTNLIKKIEQIASLHNRIEVYHLDAVDLIHNILQRLSTENLFVYFDPPYYIQGKNLYQNAFGNEQHIQLADAMRAMEQYHWITTYDDSPWIRNLYNDRLVCKYALQYSANRIRKEKELFFTSHNTIVEAFDKVIFEP